MSIEPTLLKKLLITFFIIAGLFVGYQFLTGSEDTDAPSTEATQSEQGYSEEDVAAFENELSIDEQYGQKIQFDNSFEHTNPGVSSEIIVNASGFEPGEFTIAYVRFAGTDDYIAAGGQELRADSDGNVSTRFTITSYGNYEVFLTSGGESFTSPTITVE